MSSGHRVCREATPSNRQADGDQQQQQRQIQRHQPSRQPSRSQGIPQEPFQRDGHQQRQQEPDQNYEQHSEQQSQHYREQHSWHHPEQQPQQQPQHQPEQQPEQQLVAVGEKYDILPLSELNEALSKLNAVDRWEVEEAMHKYTELNSEDEREAAFQRYNEDVMLLILAQRLESRLHELSPATRDKLRCYLSFNNAIIHQNLLGRLLNSGWSIDEEANKSATAPGKCFIFPHPEFLRNQNKNPGDISVVSTPYGKLYLIPRICLSLSQKRGGFKYVTTYTFEGKYGETFSKEVWKAYTRAFMEGAAVPRYSAETNKHIKFRGNFRILNGSLISLDVHKGSYSTPLWPVNMETTEHGLKRLVSQIERFASKELQDGVFAMSKRSKMDNEGYVVRNGQQLREGHTRWPNTKISETYERGHESTGDIVDRSSFPLPPPPAELSSTSHAILAATNSAAESVVEAPKSPRHELGNADGLQNADGVVAVAGKKRSRPEADEDHQEPGLVDEESFEEDEATYYSTEEQIDDGNAPDDGTAAIEHGPDRLDSHLSHCYDGPASGSTKEGAGVDDHGKLGITTALGHHTVSDNGQGDSDQGDNDQGNNDDDTTTLGIYTALTDVKYYPLEGESFINEIGSKYVYDGTEWIATDPRAFDVYFDAGLNKFKFDGQAWIPCAVVDGDFYFDKTGSKHQYRNDEWECVG